MRQFVPACACLLLTAVACADAAEFVPTLDVAPVVPLAERLSRLATTPPFDRPLRLTSEVLGSEASAVIEAFVERPFADVQAALADPVRWCAVLVLHINNAGCKVETAAAGRPAHIALSVSRHFDQPAEQADVLVFTHRPVGVAAQSRLMVRLDAAKGFLGTFNHALVLHAAPAGTSRTALRLSYAYSYSSLADWGLGLWLATFGRGKVGFSLEGEAAADGAVRHVGGIRGLLERNLMLYLISIDAAARVPAVPDMAAFQKRLQLYHEGAERYPRQLHELGMQAYLALKRPLAPVGTVIGSVEP